MSGVDLDYGFTVAAGTSLGVIAGEAPGIVTIDNVPGRAEIDLFRRSDRAWLRRQFSMDNGTYRFSGLALGVLHDLVARDISNAWDDVIAGRISPFIPVMLSGNAPGGIVGQPYSYSYAVIGGEGPFTFDLTGALPAGLSLSSAGMISGNPVSVASATPFTITVSDSRGASASVSDSITVARAYRYLRLLITKFMYLGTVNGAATNVAELQYFAGAAKYPVSGFSASASSVYTGSFPASAAFDNDLSNSGRWISGPGAPQWLRLDLGAGNAINPTSCKIAPDSGAGSGTYPVDFQIEGSDTGAFTGEESVLFSAVGVTTGWVGNTLREFVF